MSKLKQSLLICPGVIKSGTTSLYKILSGLEQLSMARNKELHFFSNAYETKSSKQSKLRATVSLFPSNPSIADYQREFLSFEESNILCDISPSYIGYPGTYQRICELVEDPYFIVMQRNRIDRALSAWYHASRAGLETASFSNAVYRDYEERDPHELPLRKYFQLSDYDSHIENLVRIFGSDRVLVLKAEGLSDVQSVQNSIQGLLNRTLDFTSNTQKIAGERANSAMFIGEEQRLVKYLFSQPKLISFLSGVVPKSMRLRDFLSKIVYRGSRTLVPDSEKEIVSELFAREFG